jgi:hypothetical protein
MPHLVKQLIISGVTVTTDDSTVSLRYLVGGSEVATGYQWGGRPDRERERGSGWGQRGD